MGLDHLPASGFQVVFCAFSKKSIPSGTGDHFAQWNISKRRGGFLLAVLPQGRAWLVLQHVQVRREGSIRTWR
ncbi:hypothetical protein SODALDRAFT_328272 [Sodiomyces alkalinus F11]|uniref:Uncharacterized protein n=1 Tax=Sodiomyces alkalinus (strain CBS 110278 / VKM F-3762 / F11) TaxID=1314773 RepID=A0A3N2PN07_SODAK|nr:hypothetical protein SODALDRAFT_328272 [Sodiomyces alkalinus F11]ROT35883.1 hypothetical protein SODALDRAFT_328272 [Sodiomyces alkalinus F11]